MRKYFGLLKSLNRKTVYFNLKYLPFKQAVRFPILLSRKVYLKKVAGRIIFECPVRTGMIRIGLWDIGISDHRVSRSIWEVAGTVVFRGTSTIGCGAKIIVGSEGTLIMGDGLKLSAESTVIAYLKVCFGNDCGISWDTLIMDTDFHKIKDGNGTVINNPKPVILGNNIWVGCRSLILKGAEIPDNCIIGANSVVSRKLEKKSCIYAGSPAVCVKENVSWEY
jgi:UDP-3-O-[3-hydroxymyristoyl] glucosamine N-acyltransferase